MSKIYKEKVAKKVIMKTKISYNSSFNRPYKGATPHFFIHFEIENKTTISFFFCKLPPVQLSVHKT